jgi:DNA-binding NtrC family response regulator
VYGAVKEAGGTISLRSAPGEGTTFVIDLPAVDPVGTADSPGEAARPANGPAATGAGERILIVEDDDGMRQVTRRILATAGYQILDVSDRDQALQHIHDPGQHIDLLLSDIVMPGMPAGEFLHLVRQVRPILPIVLMSGYTADAASGSRPLPTELPLLQKPFDAATLRRCIAAELAVTPRAR